MFTKLELEFYGPAWKEIVRIITVIVVVKICLNRKKIAKIYQVDMSFQEIIYRFIFTMFSTLNYFFSICK